MKYQLTIGRWSSIARLNVDYAKLFSSGICEVRYSLYRMLVQIDLYIFSEILSLIISDCVKRRSILALRNELIRSYMFCRK